MFFVNPYQPQHPAAAVQQRLPYPISREEAHLHWEFKRQQLRAHIASLPDSSYERTKFDEDENFYNIFPESRQAVIDEWISFNFPYAPWAQHVHYETATVPAIYNYSVSQPSIHAPTPPRDYSTYTLAQALTPSSESAVTADPVLHFDYSETGFFFEDYDQDLQDSADEMDSQGYVTPRIHSPVVSSPSTIIRYQSSSPSPSSDMLGTPSCSPPSSPRSMPSSPVIPMSCAFTLPQYTGDWAADAIAAEKLIRSTSLPSTFQPLEKQAVEVLRTRRHLTHRKRRVAPYTPVRRRSGSRTPPPNDKPVLKLQVRDKDGKPILACFFCRGRKIACGPPPNGSQDPTCNQCSRRGLTCNYPTENRRGQRKKKNTDATNARSRAASCSSSSPSSSLLMSRNEDESDDLFEGLLAIHDFESDSDEDW
ncbi:hypothetical protein H0H87_007724 [Tephrocybe sp. NHM501043]|nr:hypothetical protein H0H87_007724 [Tephrocybe sp. NHM501043]